MSSAAILLVGLLAVGATAEGRLKLVGLVAMAGSLGLAVRSVRMGVRIDDARCVVRNLVRTHRVDLGAVDRFEFKLNPWMVFGNETTVLRLRSGRTIPIAVLTLPVPTFLQRTGRARLADLNTELRRRQTVGEAAG